LIFPGLLFAQASEESPRTSKIDRAVARGLEFLAKDAVAWKEEHNCASCHHAALVVWAMREATQAGHTVDLPLLNELTSWLADSGDGKTSLPRPDDRPKALNAKAVWFALGLGSDSKPDDASRQALERLLATVMEDQTSDGSWSSWPETRPPFFGTSDETMTALATLALTPVAEPDDARIRTLRDKGVRWLAEMQAGDDAQSLAIRLVLWKRIGRPREEWEPLVERIRQRQNSDGGWSQSQVMKSDAWATGQAIYALAHAGVPSDDPAVSRAQSFLIGTQQEDGSWPMTSRPIKPGDKGATSLVPITGAGTAWGVLGLSRSRSLISPQAGP
jgi:squalene-hopene/tetraprenyl-beta-curcumene cyclase